MPRLQDPQRALGLLFGGNVLFAAGLFFHAFLYNFYLDALGHSEAVMGYAAASLTAGGLAALLPAGKLVDKLGSRVVLCAAVFLGAVGLGAGAIVTRPSLVYAAALVAGGGTAAWRVAQGPMIMSLTTASTRPRAFSWNVGLLVGTGGLWILIGGSVPSWLESAFGISNLLAIRLVLFGGAIGTLISLILFVLLPKTGAPDESIEQEQIERAARTTPVPPTVLLMVVLVAGWMLAPALVTPFFNIFFQREFAVSVGQIALIFAIAHGVTALAIFGSGEVATRLGPRRALAGWMLLFGPTVLVMAVAGSLEVAIALYLIQGFISPATNPLIDQILLELAPEGRQGAVASLRNVATEGGGAGGAALGGVILTTGSFGTLFVVAGLTGLVTATVLILGLSKIRTTISTAE